MASRPGMPGRLRKSQDVWSGLPCVIPDTYARKAGRRSWPMARDIMGSLIRRTVTGRHLGVIMLEALLQAADAGDKVARQALADWYEEEQRWLDAALARSGLPVTFTDEGPMPRVKVKWAQVYDRAT